MKKFLSMILALALVLSLGTVAFADDSEITDVTSGNTATGDVVVSTTAVQPGDTVYRVKVSIPEMTYTYKFGKYGAWDSSDGELKYDKINDAGWQDSADNGLNAPVKVINLTNYSNVSVKATASWSKTTSEPNAVGITVVVETSSSGQELTLDDAVNDADPLQTGTPGTGYFNVKVGGTPAGELTSETIGNVTITIEAA